MGERTMTITDRIDAITKIQFYTDTPPAPKSVKIELTAACNMRCGFCSLRTREKQPKGSMDIDLFKRITREMHDEGVEEIGVFYIGESFIVPELLVEAIHWCKRTVGFPYVFLTSNATLANGEIVRRCMIEGLDSLKWSVNAADKEQFQRVLGVKKSLMQVALNNIKAAWKIRELGGFKTGLYASSIRYNGEQQEKMVRLLDEHIRPFVDEHYWLPQYAEMTALGKEQASEQGFESLAGNPGRLGAMRPALPCWAVFTEGHVRMDGHLSACCFGADDRFDMGDLTKQSFKDAWNSPQFRALRRKHLQKDVSGTVCEKCVAYGN